jgi:hypothetical protein
MSSSRAVRYRRLALAEEDREKADLLYKLAEEADRGLLCTAEWMSTRTLTGAVLAQHPLTTSSNDPDS